jgi:hypothetical protein
MHMLSSIVYRSAAAIPGSWLPVSQGKAAIHMLLSIKNFAWHLLLPVNPFSCQNLNISRMPCLSLVNADFINTNAVKSMTLSLNSRLLSSLKSQVLVSKEGSWEAEKLGTWEVEELFVDAGVIFFVEVGKRGKSGRSTGLLHRFQRT